MRIRLECLQIIYRMLLSSVWLNFTFFKRRKKSKKIIVFILDSFNQLPHIEPILIRISKTDCDHMQCFVLVPDKDIKICVDQIFSLGLTQIVVSSSYSRPLLLFWDVVFAIDQRMVLPLVAGKGKRICIFHGQPSKGNVYEKFNYKQLDGLFFYGPMMRDYYLSKKRENPSWPDIPYWEVGQPKSDNMQRANYGPRYLSALKNVVLYAPSFEWCSSLALYGKEIIESLLSTDFGVIVKPHPAFYRTYNPNDSFFCGAPHASEWGGFVKCHRNSKKLLFSLEDQLDTEVAIRSASVVVTDYSGIAFEAIAMDRPVIFWDCKEFFYKYLPKMYGVDGDSIKDELYCNAGRNAGVVVENKNQLLDAVYEYVRSPTQDSLKRKKISDQLYFNFGRATDKFVLTLKDILDGNYVGSKTH